MMDNNIEVPDFSHDDFANDKGIQKTRAEFKEYKKMIDDSLSEIKKAFVMKKSSHRNFKDFDMFKSNVATIDYSMSSKIADRTLRVSLASYFTSVRTGRHVSGGSDQYLFGFLQCEKNYPRTYIHKESIKEKLVDFVLKRDVDFDNSKKFSRNFQVLTEDSKKLHDILHLHNLDELADFPEMEIELYEDGLLFRNSRKPVSIEEAIEFRDLIKVIAKTFK